MLNYRLARYSLFLIFDIFGGTKQRFVDCQIAWRGKNLIKLYNVCALWVKNLFVTDRSLSTKSFDCVPVAVPLGKRTATYFIYFLDGVK